MRRVASAGMVWLLLAPLPAIAQIDITYLGNSGFLVEGGERRVLVDALFGEGLREYPVVPPDLRAALEAARAPWQGIDLVLATHHHPDHFDAAATLRFLRASPESRLLSTPQALERLRAAAGDDDDVLERAEALTPAPGQRLSLVRAGISLEALNLHHGVGSGVDNVGFLVGMGGLRWLHVGDTEVSADDVAPLRLGGSAIDVALLPDWMLSGSPWRTTVREQIRPRQIVAMHELRGGNPERRRAVSMEFEGVHWPAGPGAALHFEAAAR